MDRTLKCANFGCSFSSMALELVDGVTGMMPEQVVGPAARFALGIHVCSPEEEGLHNQMLQLQLTGFDPFVNPLVAGIEAAGMTGHGRKPRFLLHGKNLFRVGKGVRDRY